MVARTESATRVPAGQLRHHVTAYLGYRAEGFAPGMQRVLPAPCLTFVVSIGAPLDVRVHPDPGQPPQRYRCVLGGLRTAAATLAHHGGREGVAIRLSPLGARSLLGVPAGHLENLSLEAVDVLGPAGEELWERLQGTSSWSERFDVCDTVLGRQLSEQRVARELAHGWQSIVGSAGRLSVAQVAADTGYSRQHFTRLFRREFGLGPKRASRIVRLERAKRAMLGAPDPVRLAEVATACGYADQAHLSAEFAALVGCSPSTWLTEDLPILQDTPDPSG